MKIKNFLKILIPVLLVFSILLGVFTFSLISQIRSYGKLINYVGIVRGGTQRLIKLELSGEPSDEIMVYLDEIVLELNTGEGKYNLVKIRDKAFNNYLGELTEDWVAIKAEILTVREGKNKDELLLMSEDYFKLANDLVFSAEKFSDTQIFTLSWAIGIILSGMALTWAFVIMYYIHSLRKLEKTNKTLSSIAYTDKLTGAATLDKFKLDAEALRARSIGQKFAVFYLDFDNFKSLNEIFGYEYGNKILKEYAQILDKSLGKNDIFCRISADHFLVLRCYENQVDALKTQQDADSKLVEYALESKEQNFISFCYGIYCYDETDGKITISDMMERANFARKSIKNDSHARYAYYNESIRQKMLAQKLIENQMNGALKNNEFIFYLQPKVRLADEKVTSAEALARWNHPEKGMISPAEFIPIFEKNLFIIQLDQYILREVCKWLRARLDARKPIAHVSVNVSKMQLYDSNFVSVYKQIKSQYNIPDNVIEIEFTESVVFDDMTLLISIIKELKAAGFMLSLDDFGKGYSSLNLLTSLPVDTIKLDSFFFEAIENQPRTQLVVEGIVMMAKKIHMKTVAEGVENATDAQFLKKIGCDYIQGYYYHKPMPPSDFEKLL